MTQFAYEVICVCKVEAEDAVAADRVAQSFADTLRDTGVRGISTTDGRARLADTRLAWRNA